MRSPAKELALGNAVEVVRDPAHQPNWEPAIYRGPVPDMRGWHRVELPQGKERRINSMTGMETTADDPQSYLTTSLLVPSRRLRPASTTSTKPTLNSRVRWTSGAAGKPGEKTGTVERVLAPYEAPPRKGLRDPGLPRDHESYLVRGDNQRLYWPRVDGLEVIS